MVGVGSARGARKPAAGGVAPRIAAMVSDSVGLRIPLALRAWDGSQAAAPVGSEGGPVIVLRSPRAIRHILWQPGELGFARAYVAGGIDVDGDFSAALRICRSFVAEVRAAGMPPLTRWRALAASLARVGAVGPPPPPPVEEIRGSGRDREPDSGFLSAVLGEAMMDSCAYWASTRTSYKLAEAQRDALDLICERLRLRAGKRLLDVGSGWGSLVLHAVVTGLTTARRQAEHVRAKAEARGLAGVVDVVHVDNVHDVHVARSGGFDAVASVDVVERVGERDGTRYFRYLHDALRPGGRLLLQQRSRDGEPWNGGPFVAAYIAPGLRIRSLDRTLSGLRLAGLEIQDVRSLGSHHARTVNAWAARLDEVWDEVVYRYGARLARVWRLYLAGSAQAFEESRLHAHQVLATRPATGHGFEGGR